ncbi:MAG TPA: hydrogenase expression/formation protein HypE [Ignavibacteria bacterium]|jgi:hydrogenase expression/formation protein HypE
MKEFTLQCPIPISDYPKVLLAHGGGGTLMHQLIEKMFISAFGNDFLEQGHDSTVLNIPKGKIAYTTDSYIVKPLFFPGGDIGSLAINGTINDLSMSGAKPLYISLGLIIEEGFGMEELWRVVTSVKEAAEKAKVKIVTGDTKVVDKGKGDGIFINTSGIGVIEHSLNIAPGSIRQGDIIIINGDVGRHGIAIMSEREGLEFEHKIESDCASLNEIVQNILDAGIEVHCMRDLTRGGLTSALNELAVFSKSEIIISEADIPVCEDVQGACEILGFDPLYVANEGKFIVFVPEKDTEKCLQVMRKQVYGKDSCVIGKVVSISDAGIVKLKSGIGTTRILDMLSGEQLPRIC